MIALRTRFGGSLISSRRITGECPVTGKHLRNVGMKGITDMKKLLMLPVAAAALAAVEAGRVHAIVGGGTEADARWRVDSLLADLI